MLIKKLLNPGTETTGGQAGNQPPEKTFTKEEVNKIMQRRVERSRNSFFEKYGVKDMQELDGLFDKAKMYDEAQQKLAEQEQKLTEADQKYADLETQHKDLTKKYGYKVHNINPEKIADIETYFKGKGIDIDENSLLEELKLHKDWMNKPVTIQTMGSEVAPSTTVDEAAIASDIFGVDLTK